MKTLTLGGDQVAPHIYSAISISTLSNLPKDHLPGNLAWEPCRVDVLPMPC